MDKELSILEDWAVEQILEWKHELEAIQKATGKAPSHLKRALRFGNELVFNPEAYGDMLERARSSGMSAKEIIQEIRKVETGLLNSKKVLVSDWVHHRTAQRTGGDTFLYMKGDERRAARGILRGEGIYLGNIDPNFISLPGVLHTSKTQGVEKQWLDSLSYDEKSRLYLPSEEGGSGLVKAHQTGASSFTVSGTAEKPWLLTAEEGAEHIRRSANVQIAETGAAENVLNQSGFVEEIQQLPGGAGAYDNKKVTGLSYDLEDVGPAFNRLLNFNNSTATLDIPTMSTVVARRNPLANRLTRLALPSTAGGVLSAALGTQDLQAREAVVAEDPSFINKLQRDLTKTEIGADIAGAVPSPITPAAEVTGFGAGLTNIGIDVARDPIGTLQAVGGSFKWLVGGGAAKQQRQILNPLSTRL